MISCGERPYAQGLGDLLSVGTGGQQAEHLYFTPREPRQRCGIFFDFLHRDAVLFFQELVERGAGLSGELLDAAALAHIPEEVEDLKVVPVLPGHGHGHVEALFQAGGSRAQEIVVHCQTGPFSRSLLPSLEGPAALSTSLIDVLSSIHILEAASHGKR